jgi:hypothetical protein
MHLIGLLSCHQLYVARNSAAVAQVMIGFSRCFLMLDLDTPNDAK